MAIVLKFKTSHQGDFADLATANAAIAAEPGGVIGADLLWRCTIGVHEYYAIEGDSEFTLIDSPTEIVLNDTELNGLDTNNLVNGHRVRHLARGITLHYDKPNNVWSWQSGPASGDTIEETAPETTNAKRLVHSLDPRAV